MARGLKRAVGFVVLGALTLAPGVARASSVADELVREAHVHESAHEDDLALRRYSEALALDPTHADAYLGLGALRFRLGDAREAVRVYDMALSHLPGLATAKRGRARVRRALGALLEADADLEAYAAETNDTSALRELAGWYGEEGRPLAQLAAWRSLLVSAEAGHADAKALREARLTVHALELIVGSVDGVTAPPAGARDSAVRRAIARIERRR
jgi:tetratricopeptide (TPR) repeat protein